MRTRVNPLQAKEQRATAPTAGNRADELVSTWKAVRGQLRDSLPESTYRMWLSDLTPRAIRGDTLYLEAPARTQAWVERRYAGLIRHALAAVRPEITNLSFSPIPAAGQTSIPGQGACDDAGGNPDPTHVFERFVIGPGNHLAHTAALAVAEAPSEAYNPLLIHGDPGLGKTHLLGAIANYLALNAPELNVRYTSAENFTSEFVGALKADGADEFKRRYRNLDVLLVDDVQFIAGKPHTEEEFFHTFNTLHEAGSQIVLTADRLPTEITNLATRLADRFEWGLSVGVKGPNLATRLTVLRHLVTEAGLQISDQEALTLLAARVPSNLRQLRGALTRSIAEASLEASPLTRELVARVFPEPDHEVPPATPETIRAQTAFAYGIDEASLSSRRRDRRTAEARAVAMHLTREVCGLPLKQIGYIYGGRDHSTVLAAIEKIDGRFDSDPELRRTVDTLRARIHSPHPDSGEAAE